MPNQVKFCFKHLRILWAIAILVMAGGQFAHAYQDLKCVATHAAQEQSSVPDKQDCPANHACCCHAHSHGIATLVEVPSFFHLSLGSSSFSTCNESYIEGPCREIDYPPQLSLRFAGAVRPRFAPYRAFRPFLPSITLGISSTVALMPFRWATQSGHSK